MNLYIETENGVVKNHPAFEENLIQAFGLIPEHWEPFVRVDRPTLNLFEILDREEPTYEKVDGVWTDVWHKRDMTDDEKNAKRQTFKDAWARLPDRDNYSTWTFNDDTCLYVPPIPEPAVDQAKIDAGIFTLWCGADNNWKDTPAKPFDGSQYKFDFASWQWVQVVN